MLYPLSPFKSSFNSHLLFSLDNVSTNTNNQVTYIVRHTRNHVIPLITRAGTFQIQIKYLENLLKWLCSAPQITTYRVNNLLYNSEDVCQIISNHVKVN